MDFITSDEDIQSVVSLVNASSWFMDYVPLKTQEPKKGGFGTVIKCRSRVTNELVVLKVVLKSQISYWATNVGLRLPMEVVVMWKARDIPGVVRLISLYDSAAEFVYVFSTFEKSEDLFEYISRQGPLQKCEINHIFRFAVDVNKRLWDLGYMNGDIKDENILMDKKTGQLLLLDLGNTVPRNRMKNMLHRTGTLVYAPPECQTHDVYEEDGYIVWSLGILLYTLTTGDCPFDRKEDVSIEIAKGIDFMPISKSLKKLMKQMFTSSSKRICFQKLCDKVEKLNIK